MDDFFKKGLAYFTFKIDEIRFIAKQSNVSIIGISESKLDFQTVN